MAMTNVRLRRRRILMMTGERTSLAVLVPVRGSRARLTRRRACLRRLRLPAWRGPGGWRVAGAVLVSSCVLLAGCGAGEAAAELAGDALVVQGGLLFDGTGDALVANLGLVIAEGRFQAIGADAAEQAVAGGADVVQIGEEEVILPGFFDLHAHYAVALRGEGRVDETEVYPRITTVSR